MTLSSPNHLLLYAVLCWLFTGNVWSSSVLQQPLAVIANSAELIFEGRVTQIETEVTGKNIYTWVNFDILDIIEGDYPDAQIQLRYLGGSAAGKSLKVGDLNLPEFGEEGIYFVESLKQQTVHPLRGWGQGHFIIQSVASNGERFVYNSQRHAVLAVDVKAHNANPKLDASTAAGISLAAEGSTPNSTNSTMTSKEFKALVRRARQP